MLPPREKKIAPLDILMMLRLPLFPVVAVVVVFHVVVCVVVICCALDTVKALQILRVPSSEWVEDCVVSQTRTLDKDLVVRVGLILCHS